MGKNETISDRSMKIVINILLFSCRLTRKKRIKRIMMKIAIIPSFTLLNEKQYNDLFLRSFKNMLIEKVKLNDNSNY